MTRASVAVFVSVALTGQPIIARANGEGALGPPTVFQRFVRSACSPCLRQSHPVAALAVLRARQPDRPDWRSLALRVTRSVPSAPGGEPYRLGARLLDGADVRALARTVGEMAKRGLDSCAPVAGDSGPSASTSIITVSRFGSASSASRPTPSPTARRGDLTTLLRRAI